MNLEQPDMEHISTEEEFKQACNLVPVLRQKLKDEKDKYQVIALAAQLGEQISHINSYIYQLSLSETLLFSEMVLLFMEAKIKSKTVESLENIFNRNDTDDRGIPQ